MPPSDNLTVYLPLAALAVREGPSDFLAKGAPRQHVCVTALRAPGAVRRVHRRRRGEAVARPVRVVLVALQKERTRWVGVAAVLPLERLTRFGPSEVAALAQPRQPGQRPIQDARQFV